MPFRGYKRLLIWASGANPDYLTACPFGEYVKYECIGALICLTSIVAGISMYFAISTMWTWNEAVWYGLVIVPCAGLWAAFIFWIDRFVVSSMRRGNSGYSYFLQALPRIVLAIIVGIIIAHPLELQLFAVEIRQYLANRYITKMKQLDPYETATKQRESPHQGEESSLETLINQLTNEIKDTTTDRDAHDTDERNWEVKADEEDKHGLLGVRPAGQGAAWSEYKKRAADERRLKEAAIERLTTLVKKLSNAAERLRDLRIIGDEQTPKPGGVMEQLPAIRASFAKNGFLDRSVALFNIGAEYDLGVKYVAAENISGSGALTSGAGPSVRFQDDKKETSTGTHVVARIIIAVTAFFILIEMTPVLIKLLTPPGPYDILLRKENMSEEVRQLFSLATIAKMGDDFRTRFSEAHIHAYKQLFETLKREFDNVKEGNAGTVFQYLWNQFERMVKTGANEVDPSTYRGWIQGHAKGQETSGGSGAKTPARDRKITQAHRTSVFGQGLIAFGVTVVVYFSMFFIIQASDDSVTISELIKTSAAVGQGALVFTAFVINLYNARLVDVER